MSVPTITIANLHYLKKIDRVDLLTFIEPLNVLEGDS